MSGDTGAETPLTVEEEFDLRVFCLRNSHGTPFGTEYDAGRTIRRLLATLDASRRAPDPAELDVEIIERSLLNIRWLQKFIHLDPPIRRKLADDLAAEYARLAEADSPLGHGTPGPEEATLPSGDARVAAL